LVERSRSLVLRVSLLLLLFLTVGGAIAAARLGGHTPTDDVGLVGARSVALEPAIRLQARAAGRRAELHRLSATAASSAVREGSIDVALLDGSRILVRASPTGPAIRTVEEAVAAQGVMDRLRSSGLFRAQALSGLTPTRLLIHVLEPRPPNYDRNRGLVAASLLALFMVLVFFGQAVAQSVTEEKSSRVVELLLTTLSPRRLLAGKILGVGVLGLALLLIPAAAALAAGQLAGGAGLPSAAPEAIALALLWFVLGYIFYSVAFAAVGALVSRQEDLNTAMLPVSAVLIAAFYLAIFVANTNPNGTVARVAAFRPPSPPWSYLPAWCWAT
jgi:ABC-2 type transport system permease protein